MGFNSGFKGLTITAIPLPKFESSLHL